MASNASATATATYDLMLLLDVAAEEKVRAGVLKEVQGSISGDGELLRHDRWGTRELAYPIDHKRQAEYHLLQFRPGSTTLLESLDRSLRITDGVIRFRIVKLKPGTPEPPPPPPTGHTAEPAGDEPAAAKAPSAEAPTAEAPPAETPPAEAAAEPATATEPDAASTPESEGESGADEAADAAGAAAAPEVVATGEAEPAGEAPTDAGDPA